MVNKEKVQQMARRYEMNPSMARKLLELARAEPEIMRLSKRYRWLKEGGTVGNQDDQEAPGQLPEDQKRDPHAGGGASGYAGG